jgi:hypothetical protein
MVGPNPDGPDSSDSESSSDDDELSSTKSEDKIKPKKTLKSKTPKETNSLPEGDFGVDFLALEPESDHDSDSSETKHAKRHARQEYWAKLNLLKYQQSFIKNKPPFTYNREANATTFKKWVWEVRDWKD